MRHMSFAVVCCLSLAPAHLPAQVVGDADVIQNFLESYGLKVTKSTDQAGDPMLSSTLDGANFDVYFYGCAPRAPCDSLQFSTSFDVPDGLQPAQINAWNRERRYGKAYLDDQGDPYVEYDVNLDGEGVGARNFVASIEIWRAIVANFKEFIGW